MEIKETLTTDEDGMRSWIKIEVNGKKEFEIGDGEPEDMTLGRDLGDAYNVTSLMEKAYAAGKAGEDFNLEYAEETL